MPDLATDLAICNSEPITRLDRIQEFGDRVALDAVHAGIAVVRKPCERIHLEQPIDVMQQPRSSA